jgi:hypothetical protein
MAVEKRALTAAGYFSADDTDEKVVLSLLPTPLRTVIIATAMPAAMRPYSMAVAADSSFKNLMIRRVCDALIKLVSFAY